MWYCLKIGCSCLYLISTAHVQTILSLVHIVRQYYVLKPMPSQYPTTTVCTSYLHTMSSLYWASISKAKCPCGIPNVYSSCPNITPSLQTMFREYSISTAESLTKSQLYCPCHIGTPSLLPMLSQYTISSTHVLSELLFSCPLPVRILPLLPTSIQNTTSATIVLSEYHFTSPVHVTKSPNYFN